MLRRLSEPELIEVLTQEWDPRLRAAFLEAIADITSRITLERIVEKLEKNDIQGAIEALNIDRAAFGDMVAIVQQAFNAGGTAIVGRMPSVRFPDGAKAVLRFDVRDPAVEEWVRAKSGTLISGLTDEALASSRFTIEEGLAKGQGPRAIATSLVGRINPVTKRREGGVIGLTVEQNRQLRHVQDILADPDRIREFFVKDRETGEWKPRYALTPKRWNRQITKAINEGRALTKADIAKISVVHQNKLLAKRAEVIARTETGEAMESASHEGYRQTMERLGLNPATDIEKEWIATSGSRTRDTHAALHGQKVIGLDTPFMSVSGAMMRHPMDRSLGAPASEIIQCRCHPRYTLAFERALR